MKRVYYSQYEYKIQTGQHVIHRLVSQSELYSHSQISSAHTHTHITRYALTLPNLWASYCGLKSGVFASTVLLSKNEDRCCR